MAISIGKKAEESNGFKRYAGIAPCYVLGVNLNKEELKNLYGSTLEKEPEYVGTIESNGESVQNARISFNVQPNVEGVPVQSHTFFIQRKVRYNNDKTKVQIIDKYGRTAWVTIDQAKNNEIPMYSNGPANIDKDYRPAYVGEEELTNFLIAYLNVPSPMQYNKAEGKWYMKKDPQDSECRLEHIDDYFKNNFSELKQYVELAKEYQVKLLFGVRTSNEGKQYQASFTQLAVKNSVNTERAIDIFKKAVEERKNAGAYPTTEFSLKPLHEYTVESTVISDNNESVDPFASGTDMPW